LVILLQGGGANKGRKGYRKRKHFLRRERRAKLRRADAKKGRGGGEGTARKVWHGKDLGGLVERGLGIGGRARKNWDAGGETRSGGRAQKQDLGGRGRMDQVFDCGANLVAEGEFGSHRKKKEFCPMWKKRTRGVSRPA